MVKMSTFPSSVAGGCQRDYVDTVGITGVLEVKVEAQLLVLVTSYPLAVMAVGRFHVFIPREERCYVVPHMVLEVRHTLCDEACVVLYPAILTQLKDVFVQPSYLPLIVTVVR